MKNCEDIISKCRKTRQEWHYLKLQSRQKNKAVKRPTITLKELHKYLENLWKQYLISLTSLGYGFHKKKQKNIQAHLKHINHVEKSVMVEAEVELFDLFGRRRQLIIQRTPYLWWSMRVVASSRKTECHITSKKVP